MSTKKRSVSEVGAAPCPVAKKVYQEAVALPASANVGVISGVPGWQYPPLPMGMMPPIPYCMPGNPFLPFMGMGMFPPFWLPAAAMAAATMPALAAASAASAVSATTVTGCGVPTISVPQPSAPLWPMMMCGAMQQPCSMAGPSVLAPPVRTSSGISAELAIPSTSCTNSVPTAVVQSPASPPPLAASPGSVCNGPLEHDIGFGKGTGSVPEDDEFANFIDSFLKAEDGEFTDVDLRALQPAALMSSGGSNSSDDTAAGDACLPRSESHSLLSLIGEDLGL